MTVCRVPLGFPLRLVVGIIMLEISKITNFKKNVICYNL